MGKIMVVGRAEREYKPDKCSIGLKIETRCETAASASKESTEQLERLLEELERLGIEPSEVEIHYDRIDRRGGYGNDEISYESDRSLWFEIAMDMAPVNAIRALIEEGFENVSFTVLHRVSNEGALRKELLAEAVADSRTKAEMLAQSMGQKIVGIESANLSGDEEVYDLTVDEEELQERERPFRMCKMSAPNGRADNLKPNDVELYAKVKIVWLVE